MAATREVTPGHFQGIYNGWDIVGGRVGKPGGLSPIARYNHAVLPMALARAVEMQLIARNPRDVFRRCLYYLSRASATKARSITLMVFAVDELSRHKRGQAETLLRLRVRQSSGTRVCLRDDGTALTPHALTSRFITLAKSLSLNRILTTVFVTAVRPHYSVPVCIRRRRRSAAGIPPLPAT
jgi:hypothetical protein